MNHLYPYCSYHAYKYTTKMVDVYLNVRFPLRAEMHGRGHITDSCFIAFITSKIC